MWPLFGHEEVWWARKDETVLQGAFVYNDIGIRDEENTIESMF